MYASTQYARGRCPCKNGPNKLELAQLAAQARLRLCNGSLALSPPPRNGLGDASAVALAAIFVQLCCWEAASGLGTDFHYEMRRLDFSRREALMEMLAPFVEAPPPEPLRASARPPLQRPDCKVGPWFPDLLSGKERQQPPPVIDVTSGMGGGAELDYLEIRLHELGPVVDLFVVSESGFNYRGDRKLRHFYRNRERFRDFLPRIVYLDIDQCEAYQVKLNQTRDIQAPLRPDNMWDVQTAQRNCVWQLLLKTRPDITNETLTIFTDLDEIPRGETISLIKHCELAPAGPHIKDPRIMQLRMVRLQYSLRSLSQRDLTTPWDQGVVLTMGEIRNRIRTARPGQLAVFLKYGKVRTVLRGGAHLSYMGSLPQVNYKLLQHGEGGGVLLPPITAYGPSAGFCAMASTDKVAEMQMFLQDDPTYVVRYFAKRCRPLPAAQPRREDLDRCMVPWALRENPGRYPFFWGTGRFK